MSKYTPTASKTFEGKRYLLVTVEDSKSLAERRTRRIREQGKLARVVRVAKAPKGRAGYTKTRWAIYAK